jgi:hypothetical protein
MVSNQILTAIFNIYTDNYIAIGGEDKQNKWRLINQGVRQGCSLFPLLFIIYINSLLNKWKQTNHGKVFISRNLNLDILLAANDRTLWRQKIEEADLGCSTTGWILLFADDVILFANSEDDLQRST